MKHIKIYEQFEEWDPFGEESVGQSNILDMEKLYEDYHGKGPALKSHLQNLLYEKRINILDTVQQKMIIENILVLGTLLKITKSGYKIAIRCDDGKIIDLYDMDTIEILN